MPVRRPTVVHVVRDWVRPSEGFVADLVETTTATKAVVVCGQVWPGRGCDSTVRRHRAPATAVRHVDRPGGRRVVRGHLLAVSAAERAAVLHAHFGYWAAHAARTAARLHRPWVLSLHGHDLLVEDSTAPERDVLRTADVVAVPSAWLADVASRAGFADERIRILPSGVDLSTLPFRERRPSAGRPVTVAFAGRFVAKKGVTDAVAALARAARVLPDLRCLFVGAGPLEAELRRQVRAAGLVAEIRDGEVAGAVRRALAETDLLLMPSRTAPDGDAETLGLVALEAQACGVPVIATRHGGLVEAVAADAGESVPEGDVDALAAALVRLVSSPSRWAELGRAGRRHVALHFELGARVAAVEEMYLALAAGRAAPPVRAAPERQPAVSVVVPTYRRRALVARTVAALQGQTYPSELVQIVVADNGNDDGTSADLAAATAADPRLYVVRLDPAGTAARARNAGVAAATGQIVAFTDDDCRPAPVWLEALVAGFRDGIGVVQGRTRPDPEQPVGPLSRTLWTPAESGLYETANIAYRRDLLGDRPFDESFAEMGEDTELAWRVKRGGAASAFAATAVVHHEVFPFDRTALQRRIRLAGGFPRLVRHVPELRTGFLWHGLFLSRRHAEATLAAAGLLAAALGYRSRAAPAAALAVAPYVWAIVRPTRPGRLARLRAAPVTVARDVLEVASVTAVGVSSRTPLL